MNYVDILLIIIMVFGLYLGWTAGFFKSIIDLITFYVCSIISNIISSLIINPLYTALPFLNLAGKSEGIKAINIIVWRVVIYIFILIVLLLIISSISKKFKVREFLLDSMVDTSLILRIFGVLFFFPITIIFLLHLILFFNLPIFNLKDIKESKVANTIMTEVPVISSLNKKIYESENYAIEQINGDNTKETYKDINDDILNNLIDNGIVKSSASDKLESKLVGERGESNNKSKNNSGNDFDDNDDDSDDSGDNKNNDSDDNQDDSDDNQDDSDDYDKGYEDGYDKGYEDGQNGDFDDEVQGNHSDDYVSGYSDGYNEGYGLGSLEGENEDYEDEFY